ncbi:hypothetical protein KRX57_07785 [Weeksellaceae bacterium TAE3-ERU29]|nr:hypothetical protein [Weeksellaceae bacterium TAE3-ERU29]
MNFESKKITFNKTQEELYNYLANTNNYEDLMPENTEFSELNNDEGFNFQLKGMPKVGLKVKEKNSPEYILFESPNDNFKYEMKIITEKISDNQSSANIIFEGKFNPMIEMMAKRPLTNFLETLANNMESKIN